MRRQGLNVAAKVGVIVKDVQVGVGGMAVSVGTTTIEDGCRVGVAETFVCVGSGRKVADAGKDAMLGWDVSVGKAS